MFHGNSMNHGDLVIAFSNLGFTVLSAEYRGYGQSEGLPSESGLQLDAQAALDFVANDPELSKSPIVVYGHSLGGAVAIDVTSRNTDKVSALIVENAYSSIPSLVRKWPMGRFLSLLCTQKWYSAPKIAGIPSSLPILMLSGLRDRYIPPSEMVELWEAAKRRPKKNTGWFGFAFGRNDDDESLIQPENDVFKTFDYGDHWLPPDYMCYLPGYWTAVTSFLDDVVPSRRPRTTFFSDYPFAL